MAREHLESYLDAAALALLLEKRSRSEVRRQIGTQGSAFSALVASLGTGIATVAARRRAGTSVLMAKPIRFTCATICNGPTVIR